LPFFLTTWNHAQQDELGLGMDEFIEIMEMAEKYSTLWNERLQVMKGK
jgi:hypothetical protein